MSRAVAPGWVRVLNIPHTAGSIALNLLATAPAAHILEPKLAKVHDQKPIGKPLVAGVGCQSTRPAPCTSSQQTILASSNSKTARSDQCTNARILLENRHFLQLLGTLGALSGRQTSLSMSLQQQEIRT